MARSFGAESLGADGFAVRGAVSAAPAVGCALVELGSNQLGWTSAPVAINSDLSLKASRSGDTFTGDVAINRIWTTNPIGATNALTISRQVSGAATLTDNTPLMKMEHVANVAYPYAGFVINHNTTLPGANPGGSYLSLGGPTHSYILQFDYLAGAGTPDLQGDVRYMLSGAQSKHIFQVNNGVDVARIDNNGLSVSTIKALTSAGLYFQTASTNRWFVDNSGHLQPFANNLYDLGNSSSSPRNIWSANGFYTPQNYNATIGANNNAAFGVPAGGVRMPGNFGVHWTNQTSGAINVFAGSVDVSLVRSGTATLAMQLAGANQFTWESSGVQRLSSAGAVCWSSTTAPSGTVDVALLRHATSQAGVRADNGLIIRNYNNTAAANLSCNDISMAGGFSSAPRPTSNNAIDLGVSGYAWRDGYIGRNLFVGNEIGATGAIVAGVNTGFGINGQSKIRTTTAGVINLLNWAETGFTRLNFGPASASFPGLVNSGTTLLLRTADDSGWGNFQVGSIINYGTLATNTISTWSGDTLRTPKIQVGATVPPTSGGFSTALYVRETGSSSPSAWRGRIVCGGDNVAFLMGEFNQQAWLGAHNAALSAWNTLKINPDGGAELHLGNLNVGAGTNPILNISNTTGVSTFSGTIAQGALDARWTVTATGKRDSQVGNGAGTWQTGYREEYNAGGVRAGFFGATPVAQQSIAAAATDPATTQTLANSLRSAILNLGLGV